MVETQLCQLRGTLDLCFIYDMGFVNSTCYKYTASIYCYCSFRKLHADQRACRHGRWCRGGGGERAHIAEFFKRKSATDGANESPVLMESSSGGGTSGDADLVATGVVSRGEGIAGERSGADVVETGVVSKDEGSSDAGDFADVVATGVVNGR